MYKGTVSVARSLAQQCKQFSTIHSRPQTAGNVRDAEVSSDLELRNVTVTTLTDVIISEVNVDILDSVVKVLPPPMYLHNTHNTVSKVGTEHAVFPSLSSSFQSLFLSRTLSFYSEP